MAYIYGTGDHALHARAYLGKQARWFIAEEMTPRESIDGLPVHTLEGALDMNLPVYVATGADRRDQDAERLLLRGFSAVIPLTPARDIAMKRDFLRAHFGKQGRTLRFLPDMAYASMLEDLYPAERRDVRIYMVHSGADQSPGARALPPWITPIRAGAALSPGAAGELCDDRGDNISAENRYYCELTATYWLWKHQTAHDYIGLCHYRRHFAVNDDMLQRLAPAGIDAVLPLHTLYPPSLHAYFAHNGRDAVLDIALDILRAQMPDYAAAVERVFSGMLYNACNMWIARTPVFQDMCAWLFPLLFAVEERARRQEGVYTPRVMGYLSEFLTTLYYARHDDAYSIVYADKLFMG